MEGGKQVVAKSEDSRSLVGTELLIDMPVAYRELVADCQVGVTKSENTRSLVDTALLLEMPVAYR